MEVRWALHLLGLWLKSRFCKLGGQESRLCHATCFHCHAEHTSAHYAPGCVQQNGPRAGWRMVGRDLVAPVGAWISPERLRGLAWQQEASSRLNSARAINALRKRGSPGSDLAATPPGTLSRVRRGASPWPGATLNRESRRTRISLKPLNRSGRCDHCRSIHDGITFLRYIDGLD